jgi:hypothetical protein
MYLACLSAACKDNARLTDGQLSWILNFGKYCYAETGWQVKLMQR